MVSGIILSREVFAFLPISGGFALARSLHIVSAFWGYVMMALHLGIHWNMVLGIVRKAAGPITSKPLRILLRMAAVLIAGYGLYAFVKNQFPAYMFLTSPFVFFDFEKPVLLFFCRVYRYHGTVRFSGVLYVKRGAKTDWKEKQT